MVVGLHDLWWCWRLLSLSVILIFVFFLSCDSFRMLSLYPLHLLYLLLFSFLDSIRLLYLYAQRFSLWIMAEVVVLKVRMAPPFPVAEYISSNPDSFWSQTVYHYARRLRSWDASWKERNETLYWGWKLWSRWGSLGCLKTVVPHDNLYMPYICAEQEEIYVDKIGELVEDLDEVGWEELAHCDFCCFYWPYDKMGFIHRHYYLWRDLDFERRQRQHRCHQLFEWCQKYSSLLSQPRNKSSFTFKCLVSGRSSKCRYCSPWFPQASVSITVTVL